MKYKSEKKIYLTPKDEIYFFYAPYLAMFSECEQDNKQQEEEEQCARIVSPKSDAVKEDNKQQKEHQQTVTAAITKKVTHTGSSEKYYLITKEL